MHKKPKLTVCGLVASAAFHMGRLAAEDLQAKGFIEADVQPHLEFDWKTALSKYRQDLRGDVWTFNEDIIFIEDEHYLGGTIEFMNYAKERFQYENFRPLALCEALADEAYNQFMANTGHNFVYLDIAINDVSIGQIVIELFDEICPKTCKNFMALCTGQMGRSKSELKLHYQNSLLHRIVKNGWIQGGDINSSKGDGGESIYGQCFEDESFAVPHDKRGIVGMVNRGRHTNGSQFYITLQPASWMNTKYVAFGRVVEGFGILDKLEIQETFNERPKQDCIITSCGVKTWK